MVQGLSSIEDFWKSGGGASHRESLFDSLSYNVVIAEEIAVRGPAGLSGILDHLYIEPAARSSAPRTPQPKCLLTWRPDVRLKFMIPVTRLIH